VSDRWLLALNADGFETAIRIRELEAQFNEAEATRHQQLDGGHAANGSELSLPGRRPQAVPIIALTASATKEYQQKCLAKGMNCFLSKPLKKETLVRTLTDVIKQAGYYDEAAELARRRAEEERARQLAQEEAELRARMQRQREIEELREKRKAREQATIMMMMGMAATNAMMAMSSGQHQERDDVDNSGGGGIGDDGELTRRRMVELLRTKGRSRHVKHNSIG
jgi:CheY-like chemotaxis protein